MKLTMVLKGFIRIIINILPLPLWIFYFWITAMAFPDKGLFLMPWDEIVLFVICVGYCVYNVFYAGPVMSAIGNLIFWVSYSIAVYISGQMYLELCFHMSDEHSAVISVSRDYATEAVKIMAFCYAIRIFTYFINKIKTWRVHKID